MGGRRGEGDGRSWRSLFLYGLLILGAILGFIVIRHLGRGLAAPPPPGTTVFGPGTASDKVDVLFHVLLTLVVIIVFARMVGALFRRFHQPAVIGEVVAGIILGPSLLGRAAPELSSFILPLSLEHNLSILAQVGILLYMFLVGLELDPALLRKRTHATVLISHASIVAPFLLGAALALDLYPRLSTSDVPFDVFALFMGVSMSVTAFPVLARILTDRHMQKTRLGALALTCAAVDDVTAWCLLAYLVSMVHARVGGAVLTLGLTIAYIALLYFGARPLIQSLVRRHDGRGATQGIMAVACVALLLSSLITQAIGVHAIFGAFILGAMVPHDSRIARELAGKIEDLVLVLFLPAFFAFTGLRTQIGLISGFANWLVCGLIIAVASAGKFGGSFLAARLTGLSVRESAALGTLLNTRGLMELIVLNIGLDLRILSPTLFAMMVIMAVVTTLATSPIIRLLGADKTAGERIDSDSAVRV